MGIFSSGSKWKKAAQEALKKAQNLEDYQRDVEFQRALLSNIRQQRMAQAQLAITSFNESAVASTNIGASANIDSALAGETVYGYETSERMEKIQQYQEDYKTYMKKYAKQQKKRAAGFSVAGIVIGALTGGAGAGLVAGGMSAGMGAMAGATVGQGVGQIASNTGQFETGLNNVIGGASQAYKMGYISNMSIKDKYTVTSIDPKTGKEIEGSTAVLTVSNFLNW